ncbi:alpha/beta fold hydrolase [Deinococcus sp. Arct2-2]|uniref:alpha/beta hydrolase family protein n=1 Tax=Deinococcus sp. Arct2-2 TaxID=2568653 RepID=UPI0010A4074C|nr:alpha/beta fold hydrolase [Deinococcus sp. Arct2-2]THF68880.1 alpha/beta fold hydrolase [Deinococcus sp. Arct2-2]
MNTPVSTADFIPVNESTPVLSFSPVVLSVPGRLVPLELKVSVPAVGDQLPVILFSHGHGRSSYLSSLRGYGPLVDFYAAHGFVVIQPTHQDSKALGLDPTGPEGPLFWRSRVHDMHSILDHLDQIEAAVPGLSGRLDRTRIAAVGHSLGGHTVAMLAGMRITSPNDGTALDLSDARIKVGVVMAGPGNGADLAAFASEHYPDLRNNSFAEMTTPALVVAGDKDVNPMFSDRVDWRSDPYFLSPGPKDLLTIVGGEHILGGVSGYDAAETTDENPERVSAVQRLTWAYLRSALYPEDRAWDTARAALKGRAEPLARTESK